MASKRRIRRKQCTGKRMYRDGNEAKEAAIRASRNTGHWILHYRCRFCGQFHIGHPTKDKRRAMMQRKWAGK